MLGIYFSLLFFSLCFVTHVFLHRMSRFLGMIQSRSIFVYVIGFIFLVLAVTFGRFQFPFSSLLVFTLPAILIVYLYLFTVLSPAYIPTRMILSHVSVGAKSQKQLESLFSEKELIDTRVLDLCRAGLVSQEKKQYRVTKKGQTVIQSMEWYRRFFNVKEIG
ncbi:hypothetical protein HY947_01790 [Candidatus Gottesmanbacteria bacterium]|nr:hypothetical protein [Candidatus Gottesmanbacteria bacterium]